MCGKHSKPLGKSWGAGALLVGGVTWEGVPDEGQEMDGRNGYLMKFGIRGQIGQIYPRLHAAEKRCLWRCTQQ